MRTISKRITFDWIKANINVLEMRSVFLNDNEYNIVEFVIYWYLEYLPIFMYWGSLKTQRKSKKTKNLGTNF